MNEWMNEWRLNFKGPSLEMPKANVSDSLMREKPWSINTNNTYFGEWQKHIVKGEKKICAIDIKVFGSFQCYIIMYNEKSNSNPS